MKTFIFILLLFTSTVVYSTELLDAIKIDNNTILLRFSDRAIYSTSLSDDKKNISLEIKKTKNQIGKNSVRFDSELIKEIFVTTKNSNLLVNIMLKTNSGFNTFQLPYSNSIIIDVFDWNKVSAVEDKYRSGLFAYESSLYKQSINLFNESKGQLNTARSMLGIVYLLEDSLEASFNQLTIAARNNSTIPDVYAALSQIYSEKGSLTKAQYFKSKFLTSLSIRDSNYQYPQLIFTKSNMDSLKLDEFVDTSDVDLEVVANNERFSNLFDEDADRKKTESVAKNQLENEDAFLGMKNFLKYIIIGLLILILFIISLYLKWRKTRVAIQNKDAKNSFEQELKQITSKVKNDGGIVVDRTDVSENYKPKVDVKKKETQSGKLTKESNIKSTDTDKKIEAKELLSAINDIRSSNINISPNNPELDNNELKSKLYSKFNVDSSRNNQ
ncbi:MAG: hypothetical protein CVV25_04785 [Ignavibacteriae bacterium HGW-Ignavibacteriae-4]|jgi:biopolymer transport protein ExbD|nr:MAG: hypothetical protein CVV25_04785 [Ignavibacteriae bacterium HGW-Ignavibacteriae-4]